MNKSDVNSLILEHVDKIENDNKRQFINEILTFERSKMDREQPHFKDEYDELIEKYMSDPEWRIYSFYRSRWMTTVSTRVNRR